MNLKTERRKVSRSERMDRARAGRRAQKLLLGVTLAMTLSTAAYAQSYQVLKSFNGGSDGASPRARLVLSGSTLYGTAYWYGSGNGLVFKVNTDGSSYTVLHTFTGSDGQSPNAGLLLSGTTLYGTTVSGGNLANGVVFKISTEGSGYTVLQNFTGSGGNGPWADLVLSGSALYGTAASGGSSGVGVVFKLNTNGSGYTVLKSFAGSDGDCPWGGLVLAGSTLYGTTRNGGIADNGVVFKVNTDGSGFTVLKRFTGSDGWGPASDMVLSGSTLYGTAAGGGSGSSDDGVIFKVNTDGSEYTVIKNFTGSDGQAPNAGLLLAGSTLYGTTIMGGIFNGGVLYKINTDGSDYMVLKNFTGSGGAYPWANLILDGCTLYGTTAGGGVSNNGVVFALTCLAITTPPSTQTAEAGSTVDFRVEAESLVPGLGYQWFFGGTTALTGAANAVLELTNIQPAQAGAYAVVVTNVVGAVTSAPAMLSVIAAVPRRMVPALTLMGQTESSLNLDSRTALNAANWETFDTVPLTNASQKYFDLTAPLAPQRFYRAWQTNVLSPPSIRDVHLVPAITLTGTIGSTVRIDYINQFGPVDAWVTLDTVTLTSSPQLYFDVSSIGQPARLWRLVPVP